MTTFSAIPQRSNGEEITANWFNVLRLAGSTMEQGILPLSSVGELMTHDGSAASTLALGASGEWLKATPTGLEWAAAPGGYSDPLTTRGDVLIRDATNTTNRLALGSATQVLTSDGTDVSWSDPTGGLSDPMTTRGDIMFRNASNSTDRLPVGTANQVLTSDGTDVSWQDATGGVDTSGTPVANDFARFTDADTIEGRSYAEVKSDLSLDNVSNVATSDVAYDATSWNANNDAATKNAIRDKIETMDTAIGLNTTHASSNGSDHSYIDQDVTSGAAPTFTADNFSDGGSNAIITTTQETNFETAYTHSQSSHYSDPMTTRGDVLIRNASNSTARLPIGTSNQVLTSDGTDVAWASPSAGAANEIQPTLASSAGTVTFTGSGLDDLVVDASDYYGEDTDIRVRIVNVASSPDQFDLMTSANSSAGRVLQNQNMSATPVDVYKGLKISFGAVDGHTAYEYWDFTITAASVPIKDYDGTERGSIYGDVLKVANGSLRAWNKDPDDIIFQNDNCDPNNYGTFYAVRQDDGGTTYINAASGKPIEFGANDSTYARFYGERLGIGTNFPSGQLHVDQSGSAENIPVLYLDQGDSNEPFIALAGTSGANTANSITSYTTGNSIQGFLRTEVNGTDYWVPYYDAPTS